VRELRETNEKLRVAEEALHSKMNGLSLQLYTSHRLLFTHGWLVNGF